LLGEFTWRRGGEDKVFYTKCIGKKKDREHYREGCGATLNQSYDFKSASQKKYLGRRMPRPESSKGGDQRGGGCFTYNWQSMTQRGILLGEVPEKSE